MPGGEDLLFGHPDAQLLPFGAKGSDLLHGGAAVGAFLRPGRDQVSDDLVVAGDGDALPLLSQAQELGQFRLGLGRWDYPHKTSPVGSTSQINHNSSVPANRGGGAPPGCEAAAAWYTSRQIGSGVIGSTTGSGPVSRGSSPLSRAGGPARRLAAAPSSRGLGRRPLKAETPVQIWSGLPTERPGPSRATDGPGRFAPKREHQTLPNLRAYAVMGSACT